MESTGAEVVAVDDESSATDMPNGTAPETTEGVSMVPMTVEDAVAGAVAEKSPGRGPEAATGLCAAAVADTTTVAATTSTTAPVTD